jgi:hypothetical protein
MRTANPHVSLHHEPRAAEPRAAQAQAWDHPVGGPARAAWRENTLLRAKELESLCAWMLRTHHSDHAEALIKGVELHLKAAKQAAEHKSPLCMCGKGSLVERAMGNLYAAEALLLNFAPPDYLLGQLPSVLNHVQRHLRPPDPRRQQLERIVQQLDIHPPQHSLPQNSAQISMDDATHAIAQERGWIVTAMRGASSAALREQRRVRSFRNVLVGTTLVMTVLAVAIALLGFVRPTMIPLCFLPERTGQTVVVCPTAQSSLPLPGPQPGLAVPDVDDVIARTAGHADLFIVELVGLTAAAVAAAGAIRGIRGSSEPHGLPVALAALKLPTGAVTAFLGLLLMRGQFVPGLSALDTSGQILAWALVFGYGQQLFTRFVDQQAHNVLDSVRGADKHTEPTPMPTQPTPTHPNATPSMLTL